MQRLGLFQMKVFPLLITLLSMSAMPAPVLALSWNQLPVLPDHEGFASPFAGVCGGALIVAGGSNFPAKKPWEGGTKTWYDSIFLLKTPQDEWQEVGHLPRPACYGVAVSFGDRMICVGGGDAKEHFRSVYALTWNGHSLSRDPLPDLPQRCAYMCGALVGSTLYIAGGMDAPEATVTLKTFWALDLGRAQPAWRILPTWPGPGRALAIAAAAGGKFYLFSGHDLHVGPNGKAEREYLHDAYEFTPRPYFGEIESSGTITSAPGKWRRIADMPRPAVAAPTPAPITEDGHILVITGDDGTRVALNGPEHPGFPKDILAYNPVDDRWTSGGEGPISRATVPTTQWNGQWIIVNGERKPGYRTNQIWTLQP